MLKCTDGGGLIGQDDESDGLMGHDEGVLIGHDEGGLIGQDDGRDGLIGHGEGADWT